MNLSKVPMTIFKHIFRTTVHKKLNRDMIKTCLTKFQKS